MDLHDMRMFWESETCIQSSQKYYIYRCMAFSITHIRKVTLAMLQLLVSCIILIHIWSYNESSLTTAHSTDQLHNLADATVRCKKHLTKDYVAYITYTNASVIHESSQPAEYLIWIHTVFMDHLYTISQIVIATTINLHTLTYCPPDWQIGITVSMKH